MKFDKMIFLIFTILISCNSNIDSQNNDYKNRLIEVISQIEKDYNYESDSINSIIPKNEEEYLIFYSLTYPDSKIKIESFFLFINRLFVYYSNNDNVYIRLLELSTYVDGEFAETYFNNILDLINKDKKRFCRNFIKANKTKVKRLKSDFSENCNPQK